MRALLLALSERGIFPVYENVDVVAEFLNWSKLLGILFDNGDVDLGRCFKFLNFNNDGLDCFLSFLNCP